MFLLITQLHNALLPIRVDQLLETMVNLYAKSMVMSKKEKYDNKVEEELAKRFDRYMKGEIGDAPATLQQSLDGVEDPETRKIILEAHLGKLNLNQFFKTC